MKLTLDKKIQLGFLGCALVLVLIGVVAIRNSDKFLSTNQWVNHTHEVLYEFEQILLSSLEVETGARGYIITGNPIFTEPFESGKLRIVGHLGRVLKLTEDNPTQQSNIQALRILIAEQQKIFQNFIDLRKKSGFEAVQRESAAGHGKRATDKIRKLVDSCREIENTLLARRQQESEADARSFNLVFIVLIALIIGVLISVYFIINTNLKALRRAEAETAEKNWNLTGSGELVKEMQGNKTVPQLAQIIINHLALYVGAQIGALYITEEDGVTLRFTAGYATDKRRKMHAVVRMGEGIVGQAAEDQKMISINGVSADYLVIDTGFGEVPPRHIIVKPLVIEGDVVGVIELGAVGVFTELHKQYLDLVGDAISIAITSSQSREKTRELLEETQRQAEELEAQQEELRQSNEELEEKTELLERSEGELKAQQEELQQSNEELEEKANLLEEQKERLEGAKAEIETKARELETTSRYKSEFLANMSHELRTPLNSVLILAQLLAENKSGVLGVKEVEFARNICNSGNDLLNLINEILDLSKVEAGKMDLDIAELSFDQITADLASMFNEIARTKAIDFRISTSEAGAIKSVTTDKQRLHQILRNLLSNAFKFTGENGRVGLAIGKAPPRVRFRNEKLSSVPGVVAFSVSDTGIGVPEKKQEIIFEAFQQADGSTKRKYGGTGLGLSISRELAAALGGEIHLQSEDGKGSTFTLYLPAAFDAANVAETEKSSGAAARLLVDEIIPPEIIAYESSEDEPDDDRHTLRANDRIILIMEDDPDFAGTLLAFVRQRGYKGIIAHLGNVGLSYARRYKPDAIILDMMMPVLDGEQVLKYLKRDSKLRHIPVQIISGYDKRQQGLELGAFDFIQKPISKADLEKAFDKIGDFVSKQFKRLLVVEDNEVQNTAICELIGNGDVKISSAYSGKEAYELLEKEDFDCVILDLGLPDTGGFDLLEKIKANPLLVKVPIVIYTGKDLTRDENSRLEKLANTVVLKTADSQERLLDETILFLHRVEEKLPKEKQQIIRKLHKTDELLRDKKVLVVDDDIRNIYSLTNALEEEGMRCFTAENGKAALKTLKSNPGIDIILMDIMMPEMDGYETTREIRKLDKLNKLPIIALTAKAMKGDREKCLQAGMSDYIAKPVNVDQLLSLMRVWVYE